MHNLRPVEKSEVFRLSPYSKIAPEIIEYEGKPAVRVHCLKCGTAVALNFGGMSREQAVLVLSEMADTPRHCPGFHVELGGWDIYWRFADAINLLYPLPAQIEHDHRIAE